MGVRGHDAGIVPPNGRAGDGLVLKAPTEMGYRESPGRMSGVLSLLVGTESSTRRLVAVEASTTVTCRESPRADDGRLGRLVDH